MAEDKSKLQQLEQLKTQEKQAVSLDKFGGFAILETSVEGLQNMNPDRKARKNIFLSESGKKEERELLQQRIELWLKLLEEGEDLSKMIDASKERTESIEKVLSKNIKKALDATRALESSYRSVALFYKNTDSDKLKNVNIINADMDQISDLDTAQIYGLVSEELAANYDRLDLRDNYSMLVIPGFMGDKKTVDAWARVAHKNKVMLLTDYRHLDSVDDTIELFEDTNLTGGDAYLSNVIMSCNYLVGRSKNEEVGEEDHVFVAPSAALAGKLYTTLMSQISAGRTFGSLNEVDGVKYPLKKSEISHLDRIGLVPMVNEYGKVMAFSGKTLFNGDNIGMQTYSVVRVFDYISKVLVDFLNRRAFENWNANTKKDLQNQIINFLDKIKGPKGLIEKWEIRKLEQDPVTKDRINLDLHIKPYFPAKTFLVQLEGTKGEESSQVEWESDYQVEGN
jgi:hypothetical protein